MIIRDSNYAWSITYENISSIHVDDVTENENLNPDKMKSMFSVNVVWQDANRGFSIFTSDSYEECAYIHRRIINAYVKKKKEVVIEW